MKKIAKLLMIFVIANMFYFNVGNSFAERIKDIAAVEGVRENQLIGYGLVVGLDGTGDKGNATMQSIANMLQRLGVTVKVNDVKAKNTAAVMVTATLPSFPKAGMRIDAVISAIGDAKSLQGGTLLTAPLKAADGKVYAVAQGPVSIGGFIGGGGGATTQKNHLTVGKAPQGAIIEKTPKFSIGNGNEIKLFLHKPDFTTSNAVAKSINATLSKEYAKAVDPSSVSLKIPEEFKDSVVELITKIESIEVPIDSTAKVVVNERTGTIVIGDNVKLSPVAIAHGNLTIEIKTDFAVSQPMPLAPLGAQTEVVPQKDVVVKEPKVSLAKVSGATLGDVVKALNSLGVTPRDLISILQALKASGALRAELEII